MTETELAFARLKLSIAVNAIDEVIKKLSEVGSDNKSFNKKCQACGFWDEYIKEGVSCCATCGNPKV